MNSFLKSLEAWRSSVEVGGASFPSFAQATERIAIRPTSIQPIMPFIFRVCFIGDEIFCEDYD